MSTFEFGHVLTIAGAQATIIISFFLLLSGSLSWKQVSSVMNMRGIKGYFSFYQASPFDVTELRVNLTNLQKKVGPFHVHHFPLLSVMAPPSNLCSNDNVGGHWNPLEVNTSAPTYPTAPGSTHDRYEIGDLSGKHMSLENQSQVDAVFQDFNLPLFGQNSIVGRSVVIHEVDGPLGSYGEDDWAAEDCDLKLNDRQQLKLVRT
uniref:Superoxide dismutase copper/zinc binding domain-containing protein n=1 Tax=Echeneis naucrates TaxID=173247 RepID=A0A665WPT1_ECHNA